MANCAITKSSKLHSTAWWASCVLALLLAVTSSNGIAEETPNRNLASLAFATQVLVAGSDNTALNLHFIEEMRRRGNSNIEWGLWSPGLALQDDADKIIIALGANALSKVLATTPDAPVLVVMASSYQLQGMDLGTPHRSAIYHDPPLLRQALLGRAILPQASRVALLVRSGSEDHYQDILASLDEAGFEARLFAVEGTSNLISGLSRALLFADFILGTPDDEIYNPRTIKHILLTAYRRNRIVVGPSRPFVSAGALASTYTPLSVTLDETLGYIKHYQEHGVFPAPSWPEHFVIEVNRQVAQSLNVPVPPIEQLEARLQRLVYENKGQRDEE